VNSWCKEPKNSSIDVRGLRNAPCPPGSPAGPGSTGATAAECGWHFQSPQEAAAATATAVRHQMEVAARNPKTRAENEAFIGKDRPPTPLLPSRAPAINDGGPTQQDGNGFFLAGGQPFVNGNSLPPAPLAVPNGAPTGLERYLLAPLMSRS
jgi:phospholipid/cholesterol/gamma-HCH transport system substrate-binding protein